MPSFNRDALRKGKQAIDEAVANRGKGGGDFRPFLPNIFWKKAKDHRFVLFLNQIEESPQVNLYPYIETETGPAMAIARTDPSIGASADPVQVRWGYKPRLSNLAIAVELEPTVQLIDGYQKPTGFEVKTRSFERRIRDDDGELTDKREEVVAPCIGLVAQSPHNFFNLLSSYDSTEGPVHKTAFKITRLDSEPVTYQLQDYPGIAIDRTNLLEYIENVSYVGDPAGVLEAIDGLDEIDASAVIGDYLLYRRIEELADEDLYNETLEAITKPNPWADKDTKEKAKTRQARPSQRRTKAATETSVEETADAEVEAKPEKSEEPKVTKGSPAAERLAKLKERSRAAAKSA